MNQFIKKRLRLLTQIFGIAVFAVILVRIDIRGVAGALRSIGVTHAVIILAVLLCFTLIKSLRWRTIVAMQGIDVPVRRSFTIYAASLYLGFFTPGRIGDFVKSVYLVQHGLPAGKAIFSSLVDRLYDLFFLVAIGYVSLLSFPGIFRNQLALGTIIVLVAATAAGGLIWKRDFLKRFARRFVLSVMPHAVRSSVERTIHDVLDEFGSLRRSGVIAATLLTLSAWILHYLVFIIFARAVGIEASVHFLVICVSFAIFAALLPVSISGLGTREVVLILLFSRAGLSTEAAVAFSLTFIAVYCVQGVIGLICWLKAPFHRKGIEDDSGVR